MPRMLCVLALVEVKDTLLKVNPVVLCDAAAKFTAVAVKIIVEVPALKVSPVFIVVSNTDPPELNVTVDDPRLIVRVLEVLDDKNVAVTLKLLVVKVPRVSVMALEDVSASPRVMVMPTSLIVIGPTVFPAVVSVPVALNVIPPL